MPLEIDCKDEKDNLHSKTVPKPSGTAKLADGISVEPAAWAIPLYPDNGNTVQVGNVLQVPLTHNPHQVPSSNNPTTAQPAALLVYPPSNDNGPLSQTHIFEMPSNVYLVVNEDQYNTKLESPTLPAHGDNSNMLQITPALSQFADFSSLYGIDRVWINQKVELLEVFMNWEVSNKYAIKGPNGQQLFFVTEESDVCDRQFCGQLRSFVLHVTTPSGAEVFRMRRDFHLGTCLSTCHYQCCCCLSCLAHCRDGASQTAPRKEPATSGCLSSCMQEMFVETPQGVPIGRVQQEMTCSSPSWSLLDANDKTVLRILGPLSCYFGCLPFSRGRLSFKLQSTDGLAELGEIRKEWSGFVREVLTDADNFSVTFPPDLHSSAKVLVIAAVFLLDFTYFENNHRFGS